jgi:nickel/cobalt exporter
MPDLTELIRAGTTSAWLYLPAAVLLGALHGLEPGHSKTMMAAFIVAIRGTIPQAILLGTTAAISHTLIVWGVALGGLAAGEKLVSERLEPWLLLLSGAIVICIAAWIASRTLFYLGRIAHDPHTDHHHDHDDHHDHHHPEDETADAHAREHAVALRQHLSGRQVTTLQIALFGFTGGLIPCPAAITVLLVCLQLREFSLGMGMVAAFSVGLAITLVAVGVIAAWGAGHAARWITLPEHVMARLPLVSAAVVALIGTVMLGQGFAHL